MKKVYPKIGDQKTITKFAWFPITCVVGRYSREPEKEVRWLEKVTYVKTYTYTMYGCYWENNKFIDE